MENILSDEKNKVTLIDTSILPKLNIPKEIIYKFNQNHNFNDSECSRTASTHKDSADSYKSIQISSRLNNVGIIKNLNNIFMEEPKIRKDNFGREIKKGGKHKIAFADDLDIVNALIPEKNNNQTLSRKSLRIRDNSPLKLRSSLINVKTIKRSNSLKYDKSLIKKIIYNISKGKTKSKKKFKKSIIHIINVENLKEETKLNTYSTKNRIAKQEEENVCCSCYCSIW